MQIKWLEDLVALAEAGSLAEAARQRHVTHPAFGRRIRALEHWAGGPLIDRSAATLMMKGMTAQYLFRQVYPLHGGETILYHAAAGGVGLGTDRFRAALERQQQAAPRRLRGAPRRLRLRRPIG